ncbi:MAG: hypothetical protein JXQ23_10085 [Clostridia bacterium]|nr:hypothetical protein [Clostridia bacterium]
MNFLIKVKQKLTRFFHGRYGADQLTYFLLILSIIITYISYGWIASYLLLLLAIFRTLSKNIPKRRAEGDWFNKNIWFKIKRLFFNTKNRIRQRKEFIYFKCPKCRKQMRVPKNKGKIKVTCPSCQQIIIKKT